MKTHLCSRKLYCTFLQVTAQRYSAFSLSEVSPVELSHDAVSRWLAETRCQPKDVWEAAQKEVLGTDGILIADETVLNKERSGKIELVNWQYSGNEHDVIRGIGVVNLLWRRNDGTITPTDFRVYHPPEDGKTKNDHVREMLDLSQNRGVTPEAVVADSWYGSLNNLKHIRDMGWVWVMGLKRNRIVNRGKQ